eukprot:5310403-Alexandrium_andersonii.AAC.1
MNPQDASATVHNVRVGNQNGAHGTSTQGERRRKRREMGAERERPKTRKTTRSEKRGGEGGEREAVGGDDDQVDDVGPLRGNQPTTSCTMSVSEGCLKTNSCTNCWTTEVRRIAAW